MISDSIVNFVNQQLIFEAVAKEGKMCWFFISISKLKYKSEIFDSTIANLQS